LLLLHPDFWQEVQEHVCQQAPNSKAEQDSQSPGATCKHKKQNVKSDPRLGSKAPHFMF
jgi:ribosome assembly protein YihI (activator of Der GTPase)